nr:hypothetical protein [Pseudenhygromyxa sp. WMMC2535]
MRGIPARVIQELAGHTSLMTTECYMHLAPGLTHAAIASLEAPPPVGLPPGGSSPATGAGPSCAAAASRRARARACRCGAATSGIRCSPAT